MNPFENPFNEQRAEQYAEPKEIEMNFQSGDMPKWCKFQEFVGEGKVIEITKFQRLSGEKGETKTKFLDPEGMTYRLTFLDHSVDEPIERYYENDKSSFKSDLVMSVVRNFGDTKMPAGQKVKLQCVVGERPGEGRMIRTYRWILSKVEQEIQVD